MRFYVHYSLTYLPNKHLLKLCLLSGSVLGPGNTVASKADQVLALLESKGMEVLRKTST